MSYADQIISILKSYPTGLTVDEIFKLTGIVPASTRLVVKEHPDVFKIVDGRLALTGRKT